MWQVARMANGIKVGGQRATTVWLTLFKQDLLVFQAPKVFHPLRRLMGCALNFPKTHADAHAHSICHLISFLKLHAYQEAWASLVQISTVIKGLGTFLVCTWNGSEATEMPTATSSACYWYPCVSNLGICTATEFRWILRASFPLHLAASDMIYLCFLMSWFKLGNGHLLMPL